MSGVDPAQACHLIPRIRGSNGLADYASKLIQAATILEATAADQLPHDCRTLILHYSGYGYANNGAPEALIRQLCRWRRASDDRCLLVVFHELFARQPPWRKGFWWAPLQRRLLRRLIACCDGGLSTLELHSRWLRRQGLEPFATLPVPSNVGETDTPLPLDQRRRQLVVFGGRSQRQAAYAALSRESHLLEQLGLETIHDVGPPLDQPARLADLQIQRHGLLPEAEVAALLSQSLLAAVSYPLPFLAKSGIFAALCAHGVLPLVVNAGRSAQADGLSAGRHFITPAWLRRHPDPGTALAAATPIATSAWQWYQPHRLCEQRRMVQAWLAALT